MCNDRSQCILGATFSGGLNYEGFTLTILCDQSSLSLSARIQAVNDKNFSKSQRIRDFLLSNPGVRNRDVVSALSQFGVTPADVSNAKTHLKKLASKGRVRANTLPTDVNGTEGTSESVPSSSIGAMSEIEATLAYVRQVGSIDRARQLLAIFEQIHRLP